MLVFCPEGLLRLGINEVGVDERRILYVITDLEVGGVPLHLLRLAQSVRDDGWKPTVVSLKPAGPVGERLQNCGIQVHSCEVTSSWDFRVFVRLAKIIRSLGPHVIHSFLFHANQACRLANMLCGRARSNLVCEIQTVEIERKWHLWFDRITYRLCRCTVGNSRSVVDHLHLRAGIPTSRLELIPGGVDIERIDSAIPVSRNELGVDESVRLLLWVGRMDPVKGLDTLVKAVAMLSDAKYAKLLLVGDGTYREEVETLVREVCPDRRVEFLGRRDDIPSLAKAANLFVFPSRTEGMPNALLEAMAAGLAVVTTDVPGCRDLISDGETGRVVAVDDPAALATAIQEAFLHPQETAAMARAARDLARNQYSERRCHKQYFDLYEACCQQSVAGAG